MEDFIAKLTAKVGISEEQAKKVFEFLRENADQIPKWLGNIEAVKDLKEKLPGGIGKFF